MRGKKILGAALAAVFTVSVASPASAVTIGTAGLFLPVLTTCNLLPPLFQETARVPAEAFDEHGCGAEIEVEAAGGQKVTAKVTDRCGVCARGDIDLSPAAFDRIGRRDEGRVKVTWNFID
ncbi:RlpA-like double-psi beta-barrel domain-containing protein [Lentzea sp. NPDC051838]|uniref:RlpA-like double-psi beta-barrel domain-containing protein n=1 Tax=Lentzea sp. NPDC051838 TaxID=3154849 RepID=UPI00343CCD9B